MVLRCLIFFGNDKIAAADVAVEQSAVFVKIQNDLDPLKAEMVAHQCFVGSVTAFIVLAQIILQIQPGFDNLAAAPAAHVNPVDPSRLAAAA